MMDYGFSTLGQPGLSYESACQLADTFGMDFIELRTLENSLDLPAYFAHNKKNVTFPVRVIGSSLRLLTATEADREEFFRYAEVARQLDAPYVRVFGGGHWADILTDTQIELAAETLQSLRGELTARHFRCEILLETHCAFSRSVPCEKLNARLSNPVGILWDTHHTWRIGGESPEQSWARIGSWVRHVHYKDSRTEPGHDEGFAYTLPGQGEYPADQLLSLLTSRHYAGGVSLEWEKYWHPELPDLHEALPHFLRIIKTGSR